MLVLEHRKGRRRLRYGVTVISLDLKDMSKHLRSTQEDGFGLWVSVLELSISKSEEKIMKAEEKLRKPEFFVIGVQVWLFLQLDMTRDSWTFR
jgi:hypothetical protein